VFKKTTLAAFLSAFSISAIAGGFSVSPLLVDLQTKGSKRSTSFEVYNDDKLPVKMEVSASLWTQNGNEDLYSDDVKDLTFFPRVFTVAPNSKQVVRLSYKGDTNLLNDKGYRLWFSEIKGQSNPEDEQSKNMGATVSISYRIGAGVFIKQAGKPEEKITSSLDKDENGLNVLTLKNEGNTHMYPSETKIKLTKAGGEAELVGPPTWHVQPGATRTFELKDFSCSDLISAKVVIEGEKTKTIEAPVNCK
jgi:P pilus assembly chaperone PapD